MKLLFPEDIEKDKEIYNKSIHGLKTIDRSLCLFLYDWLCMFDMKTMEIKYGNFISNDYSQFYNEDRYKSKEVLRKHIDFLYHNEFICLNHISGVVFYIKPRDELRRLLRKMKINKK